MILSKNIERYRKIVSFGLIGVTSNTVLYIAYLLLVQWGMSPTAAMTSTYLTGVIVSYMLNSRITFSTHSNLNSQFIRFCFSHVIGYTFNAAGLIAGTQFMNWPHALVQAGMILSTAILLFIIQSKWVFKPALHQISEPHLE